MSKFEEVFDRIKHATKTRTQVELADVLDIRQSSISDAKRRDSVPSDWFMKLFEKFGLNPDWLKHGNGPMYLKTDEGYGAFEGEDQFAFMEAAAHYSIPESKGKVVTVHSMQCEDSGNETWPLKKIGKLNVPQSLARPSVIVIKMESSSMEPLIHRGAYVGIDTEQKGILSGELYALYSAFEVALHRVFLESDKQRFILRSENPDYPEQVMEVGKRADLVIGRAVWVMQEL